ncbi:aldehyde dehydrogenase family protein [uncultured Massilia sp.]|uniref:aldehyde dehydrogenase family protein n=1 Tax=uncultured Massilia sp. TaxID=169973 RepID=UPI0025ECFAF1|nr:aldehyde dehydrogenase family protein [uncultured Massilia sp.]
MHDIDHIYIDGAFRAPHGTDTMELIDPVDGRPAARVRLADATDTRAAIAAARRAFGAWSATTPAERIGWLERLQRAVAQAERELVATMIEEYGGAPATCVATARRAAESFGLAAALLRTFAFERTAGAARVFMTPVGVAGLITPWNATYGFVCSKLATALAAGCTAVIKPSELSARQAALLARVLHGAGLPPGLFNIVTGRGDEVGAEIVRHPDVAKISFTGSTAVGKAIMRGAADTMKRVTLELGGKSPTILLDDADFEAAMPLAVAAAVNNSGQACLAGTRLLVPAHRLDEAERLAAREMAALVVGDPRRPDTRIGPMVSARQYERVQGYIRQGLAEGARLLVGGPGKPAGLERGHFVRPTLFSGVRNDMTIAREEIFGPVLSMIAYRDDDEAVAIANDTVYGLQAYVFGADAPRAARVAARIEAGRVFVNGLYDVPEAPFGGFKQSGVGREFGSFGLESYLEPKTVAGA